MPALESWGEAFEGRKNWRKRSRERKRGGEGLEGEDFPGNFGKPPDRQIRQGPPSPKTRDRHPFGGDPDLPPPTLLTPICVV